MPPLFKLTRQNLLIAAPQALVWELITYVGRGQIPGSKNRANLVERKSDRLLVAEFITHTDKKTYTTLEEMRLFPPDRIVYRHLTGPLPYVKEEIKLIASGEYETQLLYRGEFRTKSILGYVLGPLYIRPLFDRLAREHLEEIKGASEARASRSKKYPRPEQQAQKDSGE